MLGGVSVLITPLLGINASHVLSINSSDSCLRGIDIDTLDDINRLVSALANTDDSVSLTLVMSPSKFCSDTVVALLLSLKEKGLLRLIAIDEIHKIVRDRDYRKGFDKVGEILDKLKAGRYDLVVLAMTATLDKRIKKEFCALTKLTFESKIWNAKKSGRMRLYRYYRSKTTPLIQKFVKQSLSGDDSRKVIVYCLQQTRAEHTLVKTIENALQSLELDPYSVESFNGRRARRMKQYLVSEVQQQDSNLRVLTSTSAGDAGIDSKYIGDVIFDGAPPNAYDDHQMQGRGDRLNTAMFNNGPPRGVYILSFPHIENV